MMKWKDTVKKYQCKHPVVAGSAEWHMIDGYNLGAEAQAEISFKAGWKESLDTVVATREYDEGKIDGIREVVEWMKEVKIMKLMSYNFQCILKPALNKKLKEWGIDEETNKK